MPRKERGRVYVALYAHGALGANKPADEEKFHWALIIGPQTEDSKSRGKRYCVRRGFADDDNQPEVIWQYEEVDIPLQPHDDIRVRVQIANRVDMGKAHDVIYNSRPEGPAASRKVDSAEIPPWTGRIWIREIVQTLRVAKITPLWANMVQMGGLVDWKTVEDKAIDFEEHKTRLDRFILGAKGKWDSNEIPTWDMENGIEMIP
ncbi:hypothetical protein MMC28_007429 [Mycoblastus sanguinarius]|nr:hypothetical protein [Mycoblastus sanguinarius]